LIGGRERATGRKKTREGLPRRTDEEREEDAEEGRKAAPQAEEDAAKKTPSMPDFKPAESEEFQLGADTLNRTRRSYFVICGSGFSAILLKAA
jgi:hypothetical protein